MISTLQSFVYVKYEDFQCIVIKGLGSKKLTTTTPSRIKHQYLVVMVLTEYISLDNSRDLPWSPVLAYQGGMVKEDMAGSHGKKNHQGLHLVTDMLCRALIIKRHRSSRMILVGWPLTFPLVEVS